MLSPWGAGPEPADHEFLRRLFVKWDAGSNAALTLQNVVSGLARIKGKRDILGIITYFFELHDDDNDGKVDREGILRMSEALLFLSRRGLEGTLSPSNSTLNLTPGDGSQGDVSGQSINERFLGSVSAFIRRCFEYADPDHANNHFPSTEKKHSLVEVDDEELADPDAFSIGDDDDDDDDDDDLLGMESPAASPKAGPRRTAVDKETAPSARFDSMSTAPSNVPSSQRRVSKAQSERANIALDPSNPLHITLPTFRMVVLADELLEQFFESSFPASFHIVEGLQSSATASSSLTTFSNLGFGGAGRAGGGGAPGAAAPAGGRGLRGVLDNIVTDGMRVAQEVVRRMEEAQKELERNALPGQRNDEDDDDEDDDPAPAGKSATYRGDAERRSVRSSDRDLLAGADAEASDVTVGASGTRRASVGQGSNGGNPGGSGGAGSKVVGVEFDG